MTDGKFHEENLSKWLAQNLETSNKLFEQQHGQAPHGAPKHAQPSQKAPANAHTGKDKRHKRRRGGGNAHRGGKGGHTSAPPPHQFSRGSQSSPGVTGAPRTAKIYDKNSPPMRAIVLGGLDEVGKNMMAFEYRDDIVIVDMGFQFPDEDMLGVDYIIPDITYLKDKTHKIRGILITHGHLDHIGAIPYLLNDLKNPPIYGAKLTMGLVKKRLEEFGLDRHAQMHTINPDEDLKLGAFNISFFRVNHSIPDGLGIVLRTPAATAVHTGDFKFDFTPSHQAPADFAKIARLKDENITALFSDSTNALEPGHTPSEKVIGDSLKEIIAAAKGRIIIAAFASLIGRIQDIIDIAKITGRKVYLSGRSMVNNVDISQKLGYIKAPPSVVMPFKKLGNDPDAQVLILTTGSQGESLSALTRMAFGNHATIDIKKGDTVVLSSSPIPGNERAISTVINNLCRLGAKVISNKQFDVHTSGHAAQEDLKLMINLVKPANLVPIHGDLYMRQGHAELGQHVGLHEKNTVIAENGSILELHGRDVFVSKERAETKYILIDGKGIGDSGAQIIMDRQAMAQNGTLVILFVADHKTKKLRQKPDIISRGFIYMQEAEVISAEVQKIAEKAYNEITVRDPGAKRGDIKKFISSSVDRYVHKRIERRPLVLPIIAEIY